MQLSCSLELCLLLIQESAAHSAPMISLEGQTIPDSPSLYAKPLNPFSSSVSPNAVVHEVSTFCRIFLPEILNLNMPLLTKFSLIANFSPIGRHSARGFGRTPF